jgi:transcriptional regulator with XRE-family HTH domain
MQRLVCIIASMPSIDGRAKAFEMDVAAVFGHAVSRRRKVLKLTASELSRRTAELGYPISRGAIAKIESNSRSGKVDVAELLVLSAALDTPPVLLLFPEFPTGCWMAVLPGVTAQGREAVRWLSGRTSFPREVGADLSSAVPPNNGVKLIAAAWAIEEAIAARIPLVNQLAKAKDPDDVDLARRTLQIHDEQIARLQKEVADANSAVWDRADYSEPASG